MFYLVKARNSLKNIFRYFFGIHEDKALHQNRIFWIVVLVPLSIICWLVYTLTQDLIADGVFNPHVSSESLASFVNYYAFPITMLTVPLTLAVMINRFHSSKQKAKSNQLVEQNNSANNFFNHYNYFSEHCEKIEKQFSWLSVNVAPQLLYRNLFPKSSVTNFTTNIEKTFIDEYVVKLEDAIDSFNVHIKNTEGEEVEQVFNRGTSTESSTTTCFLINPYTSKFNFDGIVFEKEIKNKEEFINCCRNQFDLIFMIFCFNGVSNFNEVSNYLHQKFTSTIQNKLKSDYKIVSL